MPAWVSEQAVPENGNRDFSRYYYSFDYGEVHFIVLNSHWDETEAFKPGLLAEQLEWLREDASCSRKKWKIALIHKDVLQYRIHNRPERQEGISEVGEAFMPLLEELGIDLVFTAHLHTYRNRGHIKNFRRDDKSQFLRTLVAEILPASVMGGSIFIALWAALTKFSMRSTPVLLRTM